ncbi:hypothetical protein [Gracilimonas tropica]|uniref:hypothetical protein n=1 Tax=Gracilimonas tropica TaxID=454600 RepID=UPI00035C97F6|nr:hypothetical protein [Gracilimonas tropica]
MDWPSFGCSEWLFCYELAGGVACHHWTGCHPINEGDEPMQLESTFDAGGSITPGDEPSIIGGVKG